MDEQIQKIQEELQQIKARNARVAAEKAWETSYFRIGSIMVVIYMIASIALYAIGNSAPLRNACIPTLGYFLSTQSLPFIKTRWIQRYLSKKI